jgi:hypothetical protein
MYSSWTVDLCSPLPTISHSRHSITIPSCGIRQQAQYHQNLARSVSVGRPACTSSSGGWTAPCISLSELPRQTPLSSSTFTNASMPWGYVPDIDRTPPLPFAVRHACRPISSLERSPYRKRDSEATRPPPRPILHVSSRRFPHLFVVVTYYRTPSLDRIVSLIVVLLPPAP